MKRHPDSYSCYFPPEESKDTVGKKIDANQQALFQRFKPGILAYFFLMQLKLCGQGL